MYFKVLDMCETMIFLNMVVFDQLTELLLLEEPSRGHQVQPQGQGRDICRVALSCSSSLCSRSS